MSPYDKFSPSRLHVQALSFEINFERRKNAPFRQVIKVTIVTSNSDVCLLIILIIRKLTSFNAGSTDDSFIFRGLFGRLVAKNPANVCVTCFAMVW